MDSISIILIFIVALIFSVGFLLIVISLVPTLNQLKSLLKDVEKTSYEARELVKNLQEISETVDTDLKKVDSIVDSAKDTVESVSTSMKFLKKNAFKQSAGLIAFIPAMRLGWKFVKKIKGGDK